MTSHIDQHAQDLLAEVFGMYKHVPTALESELWIKLIEVHGGRSIAAFLQDHCLSSVFAPKPSDAHKALTVANADANSALELVLSEVKRCGPYLSPQIEDQTIVDAVTFMGGWAELNNTMPSPEARFEFDAFRKRWEGCFSRASARRRQSELLSNPLQTPPRKLLGIVDKARQQASLGLSFTPPSHALPVDADAAKVARLGGGGER